jgi:hypothetical protein
MSAANANEPLPLLPGHCGLQCWAVIGLGVTDIVNAAWLDPADPGAFGFELLLLQPAAVVTTPARATAVQI